MEAKPGTNIDYKPTPDQQTAINKMQAENDAMDAKQAIVDKAKAIADKRAQTIAFIKPIVIMGLIGFAIAYAQKADRKSTIKHIIGFAGLGLGYKVLSSIGYRD